MIDPQNRVPLYPGRVTMTPVSGQANTYDMERADQPTQEGTPLNRDTLRKLQADIRTYPIASGYTISAGDVVDIDENGKVVVDRAIQANTKNQIFSSSVAYTAVVKLNNQYSVAVYAGSSAARQGQAVLINNSDGSSASSSWPSVGSGTISTISIVRLNDTQFIVGYVRVGYFCVKIGTLSGTQISFGSEVQIDLSDSGYATLVGLSETSVFAITSISNPLQSRGCVLTVSGTSVSKGNTYVIGNNIRTNQVSATLLPNDSSGNKRICACFSDANDSNKGKAIIASISNSNAVMWGAAATYENATPGGRGCCTINGNVVVGYRDSSDVPKAKVLTVVGNAITPSQSNYAIQGLSTTSNVFCVAIGNIPVLISGNRAVNLYVSGDEISGGEIFQYTSASSTSASGCAVSDSGLIVAYGDYSNSNYGTTIILTLANQSSTAIALQSGNAGESIEVIFSGTTAASFVEAGQEITSEGVYGFAPVDGFLSVIPYWAGNTKMETGSYTGTGTYGQSTPNTLTFSFEPEIVFLYENGNIAHQMAQTMLWRNATVYSYSLGSNRDGNVTFSGKTVTWFAANNYPNATAQYNDSGQTYTYIALG